MALWASRPDDVGILSLLLRFGATAQTANGIVPQFPL